MNKENRHPQGGSSAVDIISTNSNLNMGRSKDQQNQNKKPKSHVENGKSASKPNVTKNAPKQQNSRKPTPSTANNTQNDSTLSISDGKSRSSAAFKSGIPVRKGNNSNASKSNNTKPNSTIVEEPLVPESPSYVTTNTRSIQQLSREEQLRIWKEKKQQEKEHKLAQQKPKVGPKTPKTPRTAFVTPKKIVPATMSTEAITQRIEQIKTKFATVEKAREEFEKMLPNAETIAQYWVQRARFEEDNDNQDEVVRLFEEASSRGAQPILEVEEALRCWLLRLKARFLARLSRGSHTSSPTEDSFEFSSAELVDWEVQFKQFERESLLLTPGKNDANRQSLHNEEQFQLIRDLVNNLPKLNNRNSFGGSQPNIFSPQHSDSRSIEETVEPIPLVETTTLEDENANEEPSKEAEAPIFEATNSLVVLQHEAVKIISAALTPVVQSRAISVSLEAKESEEPALSQEEIVPEANEVEDVVAEPPTKPVPSLFKTPLPIRLLNTPPSKRKVGKTQAPASVPPRLGTSHTNPPEDTSVVVLAPVSASKIQKRVMGSDHILTPVRRSMRLTNEQWQIAPLNNENLSQLLEETNYAYSPNKALKNSHKTRRSVVFKDPAASTPTPVLSTASPTENKYLFSTPSVSGNLRRMETVEMNPSSPVISTTREVEPVNVEKKLFADEEAGSERVEVEIPKEVEAVVDLELDVEEREEVPTEEPEEKRSRKSHSRRKSKGRISFAPTPNNNEGRYDCLVPVHKKNNSSAKKVTIVDASPQPESGRKSFSKRTTPRRQSSVKFEREGEMRTPQQKSARRDSTPFKQKNPQAELSPIQVTPARRSRRLGSPTQAWVKVSDRQVNFTPNKFIFDMDPALDEQIDSTSTPRRD